ncbi:MAG: hypothetical protein ACI33J_05620 [Clostridium sp.]
MAFDPNKIPEEECEDYIVDFGVPTMIIETCPICHACKNQFLSKKKGIDFECAVYGKIPKKFYKKDEEHNFCNFYCKHFKVNKETCWYNIIKDKIEETYKL